MKIIIYSCNVATFDSEHFEITSFPSCKQQWDITTNLFFEHDIVIVTTLPGRFLIDYKANNIIEKSKKITYKLIPPLPPEEIANLIIEYKPDIAIAASFWTNNIDWLSLQDSIVAEKLQQMKIKTICPSINTSLTCLDKNRFKIFLQARNFQTPNFLYVHHQLFRKERGQKDIKINPYREFIFNEMKKMNFPIIIKDSMGFSSNGLEVIKTVNQGTTFLDSKRNNSDRIIEEYISGIQFGVEIYGYSNFYTIMPPFMLSVNKYGITCPKQGLKIGPITNSKFKLDELNKILEKLAQELNFEGITQVDLIFNESGWHIIEVNTRISGMSSSYVTALEINLPTLLMQLETKTKIKEQLKNILSIKTPIISQSSFEKLTKIKEIKYLNQNYNLNAKQEREKGFCEIIFSGNETFEQLISLSEKVLRKNLSQELSDKDFDEIFYSLSQMTTVLS